MAESCNFIKKEALAQVFSCESCEIFKNAFFTEYLWTIAFTKTTYLQAASLALFRRSNFWKIFCLD